MNLHALDVTLVQPGTGELRLSPYGYAELTSEAGTTTRYKYRHWSGAFYLVFQPQSDIWQMAQTVRPLQIFCGRPGFKLLPNHWPHWLNADLDIDEDFHSVLGCVPTDSIPIGIGSNRLAWLTPNNIVIVVGPCQSLPRCPYLLQPFDMVHKRNWQAAFYEFADTGNISRQDMDELHSKMEAAGWFAGDPSACNYGRLVDGTVVRIDPDAVSYRPSGKRNGEQTNG